MLALIGGAGLEIPEDDKRGAVRRAMLLLAAGGDPHRTLELNGRAVIALGQELDTPARREALVEELAALRADAAGLPATEAGLELLVADTDLAWRAYAAGLLGEELAD